MKISKLTFLFLISFICSLQFCFGQITFQKTFNRGSRVDYGYVVQKTNDGGYIICGRTDANTSGGYYGVQLLKTDSNGELLWSKIYNDADSTNNVAAIEQTPDGFILLACQSAGTDPLAVQVIKTDTIGNVQWSKTYSTQFHGISGLDLKKTLNGGYIITGEEVISYTEQYIQSINIDSTGNVLWTKLYKYPPLLNCGAVVRAKDGGFVYTGRVNTGVLLFKTDSIGNLLWTRSYEGSGFSRGNALKQTGSGGYIIVGLISVNSGNADILLVSTDTAGNLLWANIYGDTVNEIGLDIDLTLDSGFIVTGVAAPLTSTGLNGGLVFLLKTDSAGDLNWSKMYGHNTNYPYSTGYSGKQTNDGGYIVSGRYGTGTLRQIYLIKTDSLGNSGCLESNYPTTVTSSVTVVDTLTLIVDTLPITVKLVTVNETSGFTENYPCIVSIQELNTLPSLSPNPTTGNFTITFPSTINKGTITVTNTIGTKLFSQNITKTNSANIQLNNFAKGIYFVQLNDSEKLLCKKIVIE